MNIVRATLHGYLQTAGNNRDPTITDRGNIMELTIKSRKLYAEITFSRPGGHYIFADLNGKPGTLGNQICTGGRTMGNTLGYSGSDQEEFAKICRKWYRAYIRNEYRRYG